jgi:hypothetical protein
MFSAMDIAVSILRTAKFTKRSTLTGIDVVFRPPYVRRRKINHRTQRYAARQACSAQILERSPTTKEDCTFQSRFAKLWFVEKKRAC